MKRKEERQSWHLFSCLLGMVLVTLATPFVLPKKERQEKSEGGKGGW